MRVLWARFRRFLHLLVQFRPGGDNWKKGKSHQALDSIVGHYWKFFRVRLVWWKTYFLACSCGKVFYKDPDYDRATHTLRGDTGSKG